MVTVIGCDVCESPALEVVVTDEGAFVCSVCSLAFSLAADVVSDEEINVSLAELAWDEKCEAAMSLAMAA